MRLIVLCLDRTAAVWDSLCHFWTSLLWDWLSSVYLGIKNRQSWTLLLESLPEQRVKCSGLSLVSSSLYLQALCFPDWLLPAPDVPGAWGDGGYRGDWQRVWSGHLHLPALCGQRDLQASAQRPNHGWAPLRKKPVCCLIGKGSILKPGEFLIWGMCSAEVEAAPGPAGCFLSLHVWVSSVNWTHRESFIYTVTGYVPKPLLTLFLFQFLVEIIS